MKGTVLGYDPATMKGAISADDGSRYDFAVSEWKSGGIPVAGAKVDFEPSGGQAVGIYAAAGAAAGASIDGAEIGKLFMTRPPIAAAIAMLLGCLLPVYSVSVSFMGVGASQGITMFQMTSGIGILFWAVPVLAGVVLYFEFTKRASGGTPQNILIGAGAAAVGLVVLFWIMGGQAIAGQGMGAMATITPNIGSFIILAGGALMLLNAFGVVKSFGGGAAPPSA